MEATSESSTELDLSCTDKSKVGSLGASVSVCHLFYCADERASRTELQSSDSEPSLP